MLKLNVFLAGQDSYSEKGSFNTSDHVFAPLSVCWCVYQAIRSVLWQDLYPQLRLWEFYQLKVDTAVEQFRALLQKGL